jgi:hypothetical protein
MEKIDKNDHKPVTKNDNNAKIILNYDEKYQNMMKCLNIGRKMIKKADIFNVTKNTKALNTFDQKR